MLLTVLDRLVLLSSLPTEGDYGTLKTVREAREALAFDEDAEECGIVQVDDKVHYKDATIAKDIDLGARHTALIVHALTELEKSKKLTEQHLPLYEKFVGGGE